MRRTLKLLLFIIMLAPTSLWAQGELAVGVVPLSVNGPADSQYLGQAARDAIVGALMQQGIQSRAIQKNIEPEKLKNTRQGDKLLGFLVTGRINVVGNRYRVFLRWVDSQGRFGQEYLQVANIDELLPKIESFASQNLRAPTQVLTKQETKEEKKTVWEKEEVPPPAPASKTSAPQPKPEPQISKAPEPISDLPAAPPKKSPPPKKISKKELRAEEKTQNLRDYDFVSKRLPFAVRGLAYGDVNGDGKNEVLMTSQQKLYVYSFENGDLDLLAEFPGKKLDYFVKVGLWQSPGGHPLIILTNLRGSQASSKILQYSQGSLTPVAENIPYQLRVLKYQGRDQLVGSFYSASSTKASQRVFVLALEGSKVKTVDKISLPWDTSLYNYDWVPEGSGQSKKVVTLSPTGKLRLYQMEDDKYKKAWTSQGDYGGTGNWVPVEMKDFFNEVTSDYYPVPVGVHAYERGGEPEIVVVKNVSVTRNVVGRVPVIGHGQIFRMTFDQMGFVEAWASKKVDGSIQDYLVTSAQGTPQLMAAVRLREPGLFGDMVDQYSVLLLYNLN